MAGDGAGSGSYGVGVSGQSQGMPQVNQSPYAYTAGNSMRQPVLNQFGLRDKVDQGPGLIQTNPLETQFTVITNTIVVDTRDCIGVQSLADAIAYFESIGGRNAASGNVVSTTGLGINPIVVTFDSVSQLRNGDTVVFQGVRGNTNVNGIKVISSINTTFNTAVITAGPNGNYAGNGIWTRPADPGYPEITDKVSTIVGNTITVNLEKELKFIRAISLFDIIVPRDIIPLNVYISDFITDSTNLVNAEYPPYTSTNYTTYIPQEAWYMEQRIVGFYSSPLDMWRTYLGAFAMQHQVTPPPLKLWNPPLGSWPTGQPIPYPFQTVPTYQSNTFTIPGSSGNFYLILAGYGVYDLVDWTIITGNPAVDAMNTSLIRKLLLYLICPIQSYNNHDYIDLIIYCNTVTAGNTNPSQVYGFGDFQRYVPGPGVGQNYQPGTNGLYNTTNGSGPPNVVQPDSPIPFPNFRGNVWGPYSSPGDRFQKLGLIEVVQDLYLNGDLNNLLGSSIVLSNVPTEGIPIDPYFGLNYSALISVNTGNVANSTNPNIMNAMRIVSNGFGAATVRANGSGLFYTNVYQDAGGQGPSDQGTPSAWVNTGVYGGAGTFTDPIAQGPSGTNLTPASADASSVGTGPPGHLTSFFDLGPNGGNFQFQITNYVGYVVNDIPDSDLIIRVEEAKRNDFAQSTNSPNGDAIFDTPIRLNVGSTTGTQQYIESTQNRSASADAYWEKRYLSPKSSLFKLHLSFFTYGGDPIPLERMLQLRGVSNFLQTIIRFQDALSIPTGVNPFPLSFLFDPLNPQLIGRVKRYFQLIFKAQVYLGTAPGLEPTLFTKMPPGSSNYSDITPYR